MPDSAHGHHHWRREPEGRRRQDHDDPHPRRALGRARRRGSCSSTSTRRPASPSRSASIPRRSSRRSTTCCSAGPTAAERARQGRRRCTCCPRPSTSPAPRCTCSRRPAASTRCAGPRAGAATTTTSCSIDCPPSLGILTINGLTAADEVRDPAAVRDAQPPRRRPAARDRSPTCARTPTATSRCAASSPRCSTAAPATPARSLADVADRYGLDGARAAVPEAIRFAEAPATGRSILDHAPSSPAPTRTARSPRSCARSRVGRRARAALDAARKRRALRRPRDRRGPVARRPRSGKAADAVVDCDASTAHRRGRLPWCQPARRGRSPTSACGCLAVRCWLTWRTAPALRSACPACGRRARCASARNARARTARRQRARPWTAPDRRRPRPRPTPRWPVAPSHHVERVRHVVRAGRPRPCRGRG